MADRQMRGQDLFDTEAEWRLLTKDQKNKANTLTSGRMFNPDVASDLRSDYDKWSRTNPVHMTRIQTRKRNQRLYNPLETTTNTRGWQQSTRLSEVPYKADMLSSTPFNPMIPAPPKVTYAPRIVQPKCDTPGGCNVMGGRFKRSIKRSIKRRIKRRVHRHTKKCRMTHRRRHR